ncbi:MAG: bacterioferritin, partial [Pseudomonadota bacterium]
GSTLDYALSSAGLARDNKFKDISMSNETTLKNLQKALQMELTAAHQYQLHAHVLDDWGLDRLADQMRNEMQEELGHSNEFINRIMFLNGQPDMKFHKKPIAAKSLESMFKSDLADEEGAIAFYTDAAKEAAAQADVGSRTIFEKVLLEEENHKAWLELQLSLLDRLGEKAFSAKYVSGADADADA